MYHVVKINIKPKHKLFGYCEAATTAAKNMYNVANFYIRNTMTGLSKDPEKLTDNEKEVLQIVHDSILAHNEKAAKRREAGKKAALFDLPTQENWFLNYYMLNAIFKESDNVDYRAHHAHLVQSAIQSCAEAWRSYFELKKQYGINPDAFRGEPKIPHYIKTDHKTAELTNIACKVKEGFLCFPKCKQKLNVSKLPHAEDKLIEVRIVPYCGIYQVQIVTDDGAEESVLIESPAEIPEGTGVAVLDPGVRNFATIADNKGNPPIIIKGGVLMAANQWYNKQMAKLRGIQMKGKDPNTFHPPTTKQMSAISRKRDALLSDTFYKMAHFIFRTMEERKLQVLIVGRNKEWKQEVNIGHVNNQTFVGIPHARFLFILQTVSIQYDIVVLEQEESYTSKASFLDRDPMPAVHDESCNTVFSGRRVKRGLYRSASGVCLNADVNGAMNIGRKCDERLFPADQDYSYLTQSIVVCRFEDLNPSAKQETQVQVS